MWGGNGGMKIHKILDELEYLKKKKARIEKFAKEMGWKIYSVDDKED